MKDSKIIRMLEKCEVPISSYDSVFDSLEEAKDCHRIARPYRLKAPFVVLMAVFKTAVEDDKFPDKYWKYDMANVEHIDINGDSKFWEFDEASGRGKPVPISTDLNNEEEKKLAYWVGRKRHPRTKYARWVWAGLRNRGNGIQYFLGKEKPHDNLKSYSYESPNEKINIYNLGDEWQILRRKRFLKYFTLRTHLGFKVGNIFVANDQGGYNPIHTKDGSVIKSTPIYTSYSIKSGFK
jgi:hypothetical protein